MQEDIYPIIFFCWFDKILCKDNVNLTEILNCWLEIEILRKGHFWGLILIYCAPARICITRLLVMAFNFNWFIKITRSFGSGFQSQNIAKPKVRLIMIRTNLSRHSYQIRLRNTLVLNWRLIHCLFFFFYVSIMFITIMWHYWLDLPGTQLLFSHSYS